MSSADRCTLNAYIKKPQGSIIPSECAWQKKVRRVRANSPVSPSLLFAVPLRFPTSIKRKSAIDEDLEAHRRFVKAAKREEVPDTAYYADDEHDEHEDSEDGQVTRHIFPYLGKAMNKEDAMCKLPEGRQEKKAQPWEYWYPAVPLEGKRERREQPWDHDYPAFPENYWDFRYSVFAERPWETAYPVHKTGEEDSEIRDRRRTKYQAGEGWRLVENNLQLGK